jgi:ribosomal protein S18 acetylase RimI-like enzyme
VRSPNLDYHLQTQPRGLRMGIEIRQLTARDAPSFQAIRLRSLRESPEAFGSSYDEEVSRPLTAVAERLEAARTPTGKVVFGAFTNGSLVGVVGCAQESRAKARHKAVIWGMYVAPEARGQGVGRSLLDRAVEEARAWPNVERIVLTTVERAAAARALYASAGFTPYAREVDAFRQNGRSDTVEFYALELSNRPGADSRASA